MRNVHEICYVSWNVDRIGTSMVDDFVKSCMNKCAVLLEQERGALHGERFGHHIFCSEVHDRTPAVVIHRGYANAIKQHVSNEVCALVVLQINGERWLFVSIYLPDSGKGLDACLDGLRLLANSLLQLRPFKRMVVGGDANVELG